MTIQVFEGDGVDRSLVLKKTRTTRIPRNPDIKYVVSIGSPAMQIHTYNDHREAIDHVIRELRSPTTRAELKRMLAADVSKLYWSTKPGYTQTMQLRHDLKLSVSRVK